MAIAAGQMHGFLGPNGSRKTTTVRTLHCVVGADSGAMRMFGLPVPQELPTVIDRVGAIVDSPQFFGNLPGRRTLRCLPPRGECRCGVWTRS